jgi:hypothetical protein
MITSLFFELGISNLSGRFSQAGLSRVRYTFLGRALCPYFDASKRCRVMEDSRAVGVMILSFASKPPTYAETLGNSASGEEFK